MMFRLSSISGAALASLCAASVLATTVAAEDLTTDIGTLDKEAAEKAFPAKPPYSPYAGRNFPTRPYFGDTHTHTSYSMDAGAFGARLGPKDAYRFAKGEEVIASSGQRAKLSRPLDFMVVADHSDGMGFFPQLIGGDPGLLATPQGAKRSRRRKKPMNLAASLLSSAMSGPRTLAATTFIEISFGATTEQRRVSSNLSPRCRRWAVQIPVISGNGWRCAKKKPAPKFLRSRTTAI
jgi:hypothetical protein